MKIPETITAVGFVSRGRLCYVHHASATSHNLSFARKGWPENPKSFQTLKAIIWTISETGPKLNIFCATRPRTVQNPNKGRTKTVVCTGSTRSVARALNHAMREAKSRRLLASQLACMPAALRNHSPSGRSPSFQQSFLESGIVRNPSPQDSCCFRFFDCGFISAARAVNQNISRNHFCVHVMWAALW
jgi:hypothetical protein